MKMIKTLIALTFSAALVPALALGTTAFAQDQRDVQGDQQQAGEQRSGEQRADQQRAAEQFMSRKPAGALYADDVIGKTVKHRGSGDDVGEIQDLIIGEDGRIVGVVIKSGGFLGLGGQNVGLGWNHIEHAVEDDESVFYTDMDKKTLRSAAKYERN